jgi:membrane protein DedA with SNARE-associated domain
MNGAQVVCIILYLITLVLAAFLDGKPKTGKHSFALTFVSAILGCALLYWGGFWTINK